ncbi:hypothetical protein L596_025626 [Steinernema carpocapsae]|uniref:Uncharacterized protein n=1 Tax=Steinernema carpocapsae TaxID=34508 RepID=A0A4V5ZYV2_STECR|nr:hypothetical protein L596_025626 [Steinernema carpocapsae]
MMAFNPHWKKLHFCLVFDIFTHSGSLVKMERFVRSRLKKTQHYSKCARSIPALAAFFRFPLPLELYCVGTSPSRKSLSYIVAVLIRGVLFCRCTK